MSGLLLKDLLANRKQLAFFVGLLIFYSVIFSMGSSGLNSFLPAFTAMMMISLQLTMMANDDQVNFSAYALSMPIRRRDIVRARYLMGIFGMLVGIGISAIYGLILSQFQPFDWAELWPIAISSQAVALFFQSLIFPIVFRLGTENSRVLSTVVMVLPIGVAVIVLKFFPERVHDFISRHAMGLSFSSIAPFLVAFAVLCYGISLLISQALFATRDL